MLVVDVFSDVASSQFKQQLLFSNLVEQDHSLSNCHGCIATSYGKGITDGLCETVNRYVWNQVKTGKVTISEAPKYTEISNEQKRSMHVDICSTDIIYVLQSLLDECCGTKVGVPNTHSIHRVFSHESSVSKTSYSIKCL